MGDTRGEVTGRVDGVTGGATERVTDDDDDERDAKRTDRGLGVTRYEDPQDQDGGADGLSEAVPTVGADLGAGGEDTKLEGGVTILIEVLLEGQPAQDGPDEGTEELGNDINGNVRGSDKSSSIHICRNAIESRVVGIKEVGDNLCNGDCGVQVAAGAERDVDAGKDR